MVMQIPPELRGLPPAPPAGGFVDAPSEDPMLRQQQASMGMGMTGLAAPEPYDTGLMSPLSPGFPAPAPQPGGGVDPILQQLLGQVQGAPILPDKTRERKGKVRKPTESEVLAVADRDRDLWADTVQRMADDIALYRQHTSTLPKSFREDRDTAIKSAEFSTLVNKLSNMFAGASQIYDVPWDTTSDEKSAQIIEDALYMLRKLAKRTYARRGGNLQREEFWYMFLHGRYVKRILPDLNDPDYPYIEELLDPATCFPTYGGVKTGMIRMVRRYESTTGDILTTYGSAIPKLEEQLAKKLGYEKYNSAQEYMNETGEVIEYWDSWHRYVSFKGQTVVPVTAHELGFVPFVMPLPFGEPMGMATPGGAYTSWDRDSNALIPVSVGPGRDMAEKGVSVYHYLKNTHRLKEMLMTLLFNEVEKATDPATITYTAPHLGNKEPKPLDTKRGGNNVRQLNYQKVEGVPTSPKPTDFSPLYQTTQQEFTEGSFPPGMYGAEQGSNLTGSGADAMMQNAKDLVTPYIQGWEQGQSLECEMKLLMYRDIISPTITIAAPHHDSQGSGAGDVQDLSIMDIQAVGTFVDVRMIGLTIQNKAQLIASVNQAVQGGLMSQRMGMIELNDPNPNRTFSEIISERAMQHPEIMENFVIPEALMSQGNEELAKMWMEIVVAPKLMQQQAAMGTGMDPNAPAPQGSQAAPNPLQGIEGQAPGGPPPGEGRGPAPEMTGI